MTKLHRLFTRVHARYTRSAHVADLEAFADWLSEKGYRTRYSQRLVFRTMRSLDDAGLPPGRTWTPGELDDAFRRTHQRREYRHAHRRFGGFLESVGRLTQRPETVPFGPIISAYRLYLGEVRGLAPATIIQHVAEVVALVLRALPEGKALNHLTSDIVEQHIERRAREVGRSYLAGVLAYLRCFLRFCHDRGVIPTRLDISDRPAGHRGELPPRALDWSLIQQFLASIDRTDRTGWRDFMMFYLMAHYGLRPGEVTRLTAKSIDWTARTLFVEQPKTHSWLTLPLMAETLPLLRRYLREGRRSGRNGELFSTVTAPFGPVSKSTVSQLFKSRVRKSGLPIAHATPYALRHSFAMRLFAGGVGIKAIGDLMGHNSLDSTTIYLRLQTDALREVALPVPTEDASQGGAS